MINNRIVIKNMVCPRCIDSVSQIFDDLKINYENVEIGLIKLNQDDISEDPKVLEKGYKFKGGAFQVDFKSVFGQ